MLHGGGTSLSFVPLFSFLDGESSILPVFIPQILVILRARTINALISVWLLPMCTISPLFLPMSLTMLLAFACLLLAYVFSFFLFFNFRHFAFAVLSSGDSIWIGLSAGFGETCLPPGLGRRLGVLCNARYNQVEPTRYVGLQKVRLDGIYRRSF